MVIRFRCHYCERQADLRLAKLAGHYGSRATLGRVLADWISKCRWDPDSPFARPRKYGHRCGAYCPDVGRTSPPDHPPAMQGLRVLEGGRGELLPAEPAPAERRRRIGGPEE